MISLFNVLFIIFLNWPDIETDKKEKEGWDTSVCTSQSI